MSTGDPFMVNPVIGIGSSGHWLTSTGTSGATWTTSTVDSGMTQVKNRLDAIEKRLLILQPQFELHEKYPALKEAYEAYQTIAAIVDGPKGEPK